MFPYLFRLCLTAAMALLFSACHTPYVDVTATQDPKYSVGRANKFALAELNAPSLTERLASDTTQQQMRAMGFAVVAPAQADYLVRANILDRDLTVVDSPSGPSMGVGVGGFSGGGGGGVFSGIGVGVPIGSPQAETLKRKQLDIAVETTGTPRVVVWQGKAVAELQDENEYPAQFYRALLLHVGETFNGTVRLDKIPAQ